jgi:flagellar M-ring protein FliF
MNFDVVNSNSESYNPDGQVVRSTQTTSEDSADSSSSGSSNAVSVQNNLPGLPGGAAKAADATPTSKTAHNEEVTNYEISKTVESLQRASGQVQKLSIAVLVDGRYVPDATATPPKDAPKDWQAPEKYVPRDQAELDKITTLVKSAVGYDENRGDSVQVVNMQFAEEPMSNTPVKDDSQIMGFQKADLLGVAETLTLSIVAVLVILLVLRPLAMHMIQSTPRLAQSTVGEETGLLPGGARPAQLTGPQQPGGGGGGGELDGMIDMSQVEGKVKASSVQKISELVENHPAETVAVIRSWMSQES